MVFLILEAHGALHFSRGIDKRAQRIARQRVIIAAGVYVFELARLVVTALGISALEEKALNLIGGVERVAFFLVHVLGKLLEQAADVGGVRLAAFVDDIAKDQDLAGTKNIRRAPVKRAPIHGQAKVAFALSGKAADRRSVKSQVVPALDQELLVVVQHMQPAFKIAEEHGYGLDALLIGQILEPGFLDLVHGNAIFALLLRLQVQVFQFVI